MAGIAGIFRRNGEVERNRIAELLDTLDYRGHDGRDAWVGDGVVLGHQHFWTTPQSVGERQPVDVDGVRVALAGRLDDRAALAGALPTNADLEETSDAELFGYAYAAWGPDCLDRAAGAFGVAFWDHDRERLVCARDKTGIRHVFVARTDDGVVFGSDVSTVRAHPDVDAPPDDRSMGGLLLQRTVADDASFYRGVGRLPAGTRLVADGEGVRTERYWHPADGPDLRGASDSDLRSRLRATLREAVASRLRCRERPGLLMSGGLDSTTVAGVASHDLGAGPRAFSLVFEDADDERLTRGERERMSDVAEAHDLDHRELIADDARPLDDPAVLDAPLAESPCLEAMQPAIDRLYRETAGAGHRVALTGHGGDALNGSRFAYTDLLRRGRLPTLVRTARLDEMKTLRLLLWFGLAPTVPPLARWATGGDDGPPEWAGPALRTLEFPDRTAPARFRSYHRARDYEQSTGLRREHKLHAAHRRALRHGLELRMPFLDSRVVETVYAIPPHRLLAGGEPNGLFRATFGDVLPASVRGIRKGRHFNAVVVDGLARRANYLETALTDTELEAQRYVAEGAPRSALDAFLAGEGSWQLAWRLYACERWMKKS